MSEQTSTEKDAALTGLILPVLTPFRDDNTIDETALIKHLEHLEGAGIKRIMVNGTTGEFFSLTTEEQKQLFRVIRAHFKGILFFHAGADSLKRAQELAVFGEDHGADAIVALPPYYFANSHEDGIVAYFKELINTITLPFLLYNFPYHTNNDLTPEIMQRVPHFGYKDSSSNLNLLPHTPRYYMGDDARIVEASKAGSVGNISGISNVVPELYVALEAALEAGDLETAEKHQKEVHRLLEVFAHPKQIAMLKQHLTRTIEGYPTRVRLPLVGLTQDEAGRVDAL